MERSIGTHERAMIHMYELDEIKQFLKQLSVSQAKTDEQLAELRASQAKHEEQNAKGFAELRAAQAKTERLIHENNRQLADIGFSNGDAAEDFFYKN